MTELLLPLAMLLPPLLLEMRGVPGFFLEHWITVHIKRAKDKTKTALTTAMTTGWVTKAARPPKVENILDWCEAAERLSHDNL